VSGITESISPILQWINAHPHLSGLVTFLISAAESVAIIGTIVPGTVMMTAIGTLAGAEVIPLWPTILWAILGAIVGDGISYWIGVHFKDKLHEKWPFRSHPELLRNGENFFHRFGGMSVFIGRFVGPVRALVPLVAGMLGMKPLRFFVANLTSAIGWAPAYMLPGILLGAVSLELPADIAIHVMLMVLLVALFVIFCIWTLQKSFILIGNQINTVLTYIWKSLGNSPVFFHITTLLKHHNPKKTHGQLTLAFYFIVTTLIFLILASYITIHGSQDILINKAAFYLFRSLHTPFLDNVMIYVTIAGESRVLLPLSITLAAWLSYRKRFYTAFHVLLMGVLTVVACSFFKHFVHSARPWGILVSPNGYSFPSGHATFSTVFYMGIALIFAKALHLKKRQWFYSAMIVFVALIGVSRLYLGAHWLTDVLGGFLLGAAILMLIGLSYRRKAENKLEPKGIILVTLLTLFISYSIFFHFHYAKFKNESVRIEWPVYSLSVDAWWSQQSSHFPLYRSNRLGMQGQLLNVQWMGELDEIKSLLMQNGWQVPPQRNWISVLLRIADVESGSHVPLVIPLYFDHEPVLVLTKTIGPKNKLVILRLWKSNMILEHSHTPLWVGFVEIIPRTYSWIFRHTKPHKIDISTDLLFQKIPQNYQIKQIPTSTENNHSTPRIVILIKKHS